ncbi:hypothetical protein NU10_01895 [Flavobacterium dauae]|uniref:hypothetical protein n=1 Tax=Flavobacterium dauae TaxID=1563479 RepID=UPI00101B4A8D|nr:hypothetical protein [Flavobacterium dauae]WLD24174.1 hypothetical protein NU10_01895 [Flavobacterium dauae]
MNNNIMNLKTSLFFLFLLSFVENGNAQAPVKSYGFAQNNNSFQEASGMSATLVNITTREKINTLGSEYVDESFREATVNGGSQYFDLRYNNYTGFFEYKKSATETISLSKESNTAFSFKDGRTYLLKKYKVNKIEKEDYLELVGKKDSKVNIYKLERIEFIPYKEALSSYQEQKLPEYKAEKPLYFIEFDEKIIPIEKSKDLKKAFPNHSKEIKKLISQKNIDVNSDDMLLVQDFLNSIL